MEDSSWEWLDHYDDCNFDFSNPDDADIRSAAGGLWINADALARFGHLFLNRGNWNGEQIISEGWIEQATVNQVPASIPLYDDYGATRVGAGRNGYNWWVNGAGKNGKLLWPHAPPGTYAAVGAHNNWCWVIPEWDMVIVRIGRDNPHYVGNFDKRYETFFTILSQAIMDSDSKRRGHDYQSCRPFCPVIEHLYMLYQFLLTLLPEIAIRMRAIPIPLGQGACIEVIIPIWIREKTVYISPPHAKKSDIKPVSCSLIHNKTQVLPVIFVKLNRIEIIEGQITPVVLCQFPGSHARSYGHHLDYIKSLCSAIFHV
jgi:hypothetical protein